MKPEIQFSFSEKTDVGLRRAANEDLCGHAKLDWGSVFVLCDGMGGHRGGATAAAIGVERVLEMLHHDPGADVAEAIHHAITFANEQIYATAANDASLKGMGATCVTIVQRGNAFWIGHVGDSRAYLWSEGRLHKLTRDHSFVQGLVDQGILDEEKAEEHPRKNELLRALGVSADVHVETTEHPVLLQKGDLLLVCSDGLNGMTGDKGIVEVLAKGGSLDTLASTLIEEAKAMGGHDNITVQLLQVTESPHKASRFLPIQPRIDLRRTLPLGSETPAPDAKAKPKRTWMLVLGITGVLALVFAFWMYERDAAAKRLEQQEALRVDSLAKADSIKKRVEFVRDSTLEAKADSTLKAKADSTAKAALKPPKGGN